MSDKHAQIERIRGLYPYRFDNPVNGMDMRSRLCYQCVAIDSLFSHTECGDSICRVYNTLRPKGQEKIVYSVNKPFV
jgi:hypothetical protein